MCKTLTNHDILRWPSEIIVLSFYHQVCFHILITSWQLREAICHFSLKNVVPITHEQNIICGKTCLDGATREQIIICRKLFAGHVVGSWPMIRSVNGRFFTIFVHCIVGSAVICLCFFSLECRSTHARSVWDCSSSWLAHHGVQAAGLV